jgi:hypothetical protein
MINLTEIHTLKVLAKEFHYVKEMENFNKLKILQINIKNKSILDFLSLYKIFRLEEIVIYHRFKIMFELVKSSTLDKI